MKRDRNILEIVRGLLFSDVAFQEIFKKYEEGRLHFSDIGCWVDDKGQSLLYNLKEQSHSFCRYKSRKPISRNEWLLDLVIGSIFHEAMKLRENIYQMEVYQPLYLQYKSKVGKSNYEKDYLQRFERIVLKAKQGVIEGMEETKSLFQDAMAQLIDVFKRDSNNRLLVRFLLENLSLLQKGYGPKKKKEIFDLMFTKGLLDAYRFAGQSYLESKHYDLASDYFSKALEMDPDNCDLQFLLNFSLGMNEYYKNAYSKCLSCFSKLIPFNLEKKMKKEHLRRVEEVCHKIFSELKEERGSKAARKAGSLVDRIRKCYDKM
ncbi:MAG: tetratricopeptide repeat protein [Thermodesulfobacteriota bacterium]